MEKNEMLIKQKNILRDDSFCLHTILSKKGEVDSVLRNGIEEEFYEELLKKYNEGFDFSIVFFDEIDKKNKDKFFVKSEDVALGLSLVTVNNSIETYKKITDDFFTKGLGEIIKNDETLKEKLTNSSLSKKKQYR